MAKSRLPETPSYIYVIGATDRPLKVGHSLYPDARLDAFRKMTPDRLDLLHLREVRWAERLFAERYAHALLWPRRVQGEWFDVSDAEAILAVDLAVEGTQAGRLPPGLTGRQAAGFGGSRKNRRAGFLDVLGPNPTSDQVRSVLAYRDLFDSAEDDARKIRKGLPTDREALERLAALHAAIEGLSCKAIVTLFVECVGRDECLNDLPGSGRQGAMMRKGLREMLPHILRLTTAAPARYTETYPVASCARAA